MTTYLQICGIVLNVIVLLILFLLMVSLVAKIFYAAKYRRLTDIQKSKEYKDFMSEILSKASKEEIEKNDGKIVSKMNFEEERGDSVKK